MAFTRLGFDTLSALILAATAALGAYLPVFLAAVHKRSGGTGRSLTFVLLNMFSAGVMVSAGFCHLLGEALKLMPQYTQFPLATFLCGTGFLLTLVADRFAHQASGASSCHGGGAIISDGRGGSSGDRALCSSGEGGGVPGEACAVAALAGLDLEKGRGYAPKNSIDEEHARLLNSSSSSASGSGGGGGGGPPGGRSSSPSPFKGISSPFKVHGGGAAVANGGLHEGDDEAISPRLVGMGNGSMQYRHPHAAAGGGPGTPGMELELEPPHVENLVGGTGLAALGSLQLPSSIVGAGGSGEGTRLKAPLVQRMARVSFITAMLMGVALCFHSLLEGAAMGAQETVSNSLHIFIAIVSHKGLAAYALGSSIVDSEASSKRFWSVILPFTLASPVGIYLGFIISDLAQGTGAASLSALASGTFLYVAFMEIIPRELKEGGHTAMKLTLLLLGYGAMSVLAVWA